jgi:hypothetical protein
MKKIKILLLWAAALLATPVFVSALSPTLVPGHGQDRYDMDNNGVPDAGVYVNGHYESVYAYDASGNYYWNLGDGRVQSSTGISSVDDLDQATLTICEYVVNYRADFGNTPYMDKGWISQRILCRGHDYPSGPAVFFYLIVHATDPRYTGNSDYAVWGDWEYFAQVESGTGNLPRMLRY